MSLDSFIHMYVCISKTYTTKNVVITEENKFVGNYHLPTNLNILITDG